MSLLARLFGTKYDDQQLASHAQNALGADPLVTDAAALTVSSDKGMIMLAGTVHSASEKDRIEGLVRSAISTVGLKSDRIVNEIKVG